MAITALTITLSSSIYSRADETFSVSATAFKIGIPAYGGGGCPPGTLNLKVSAQGKVNLVTEGFYALDPKNNSNFMRMSCNLRFPISMVAGYKLTIKEVRNHVRYSKQNNEKASLEQRLSFVGNPEASILYLHATAGTSGLNWKHAVPGKNLIETDCSTGRDIMIALDSNALFQKNKSSETSSSYIGFESIEFQIKAMKCKSLKI